MPRIEELSSKAHDLYWQIEDWMSDFQIPEERVNEALSLSTQLDDELWSSTMAKLPENHFTFAIDASVDSLSHNANHSRWGKLSSDQCTICCKEAEQTNPSTCSQSLPSCLTIGRYCIYNAQHDRILLTLFKHLQQHLPPGTKVVAVCVHVHTKGPFLLLEYASLLFFVFSQILPTAIQPLPLLSPFCGCMPP